MKTTSKIFLSCLFVLSLTSRVHSQVKEGWAPPKSADAYVNPLAGLQPTPVAKQLFQSYCAPCHGEKGKGDGPVGASLNPPPFNLMKQKVDNETDGALFWRITNGHKSMPTFKNTLTEMQRWQVIVYIRYLQQQVNQERKKK